jgi:hypothetical protein
MEADELCTFFNAVANANRQQWSESAVHALAKLTVPDRVLGSRKLLLRADATLAHSRWYLEGLVDLAVYERDETRHIGHLAGELETALLDDGVRIPPDELVSMVRIVARLLWRDIQDRRTASRARMNVATKRELWFATEPQPRCYLCGYRFTAAARDRFLGRGKPPPPLPSLVDFTRPRGLKVRHLQIEIDHVDPVAGGGSNDLANLKLACGWCNQVKNRFGSLHDVASWPVRNLKHPKLGWVTVPQPLWMLRTVSMRGRCEHLGGCEATLRTDELFAAPARNRGALTPANVRVVCHQHDPWASKRLISATLLPS